MVLVVPYLGGGREEVLATLKRTASRTAEPIPTRPAGIRRSEQEAPGGEARGRLVDWEKVVEELLAESDVVVDSNWSVEDVALASGVVLVEVETAGVCCVCRACSTAAWSCSLTYG